MKLRPKRPIKRLRRSIVDSDSLDDLAPVWELESAADAEKSSVGRIIAGEEGAGGCGGGDCDGGGRELDGGGVGAELVDELASVAAAAAFLACLADFGGGGGVPDGTAALTTRALENARAPTSLVHNRPGEMSREAMTRYRLVSSRCGWGIN